MADAAVTGHYDDFLSPLDMPITALITDLRKIDTPAALVVAQQAIDGEFDATEEEADAWFALVDSLPKAGRG